MPDSTTFELKESHLREIVKDASLAAIAEHQKMISCHFNEHERKDLHALSDALREEGGNHGTFRVLIQLGTSFQDITKTLRKAGIVLLLLILVVAGASNWPEILKWIVKWK